MDTLAKALANPEIRLSERRVFMVAGSDLEMVSEAWGFAEHRLIISDDARPQDWHLEKLVGWRIRMISAEPRWRLLIADDSALLTKLDDAYRVKNVYSVKGDDVERVVAYFENLWADAIDYEIPTRIAPAPPNQAPPDQYWDDTIARLASNPSELRELDSDEFERLVAELLRRDGMQVQLTAPTRDGGRDILAWSTSTAGRSLCLVECKRYSEARKVNVSAVRALFGVLEQERATTAMIVTTSSFTAPARHFRNSLGMRVLLRDYGDVAKWLRQAAEAILDKRYSQERHR